ASCGDDPWVFFRPSVATGTLATRMRGVLSERFDALARTREAGREVRRLFTSVNIQGFRGFETLSVDRLAKVNVLIGANNAGKTALLEAVELLGRGPDPTALVELLQRREEYALGSGPSRFPFDPRSLFYGRTPTIGSSFRLSAQEQANERDVIYECSLQHLEEDERTVLQVQLALEQPSD